MNVTLESPSLRLFKKDSKGERTTRNLRMDENLFYFIFCGRKETKFSSSSSSLADNRHRHFIMHKACWDWTCNMCAVTSWKRKNVPDLCAFFVLSSMSRANTKKQIPPVTEWGTKSQKTSRGKNNGCPQQDTRLAASFHIYRREKKSFFYCFHIKKVSPDVFLFLRNK